MGNNRIVHFEIPANEPQKLTKFYSDLFGWKFQKAAIPGPEYWLCDTGKEGPGPLVSSIGKNAGDFPIPVAIVPGHLSDEELDAMS